jgi:hypothetical protein
MSKPEMFDLRHRNVLVDRFFNLTEKCAGIQVLAVNLACLIGVVYILKYFEKFLGLKKCVYNE